MDDLVLGVKAGHLLAKFVPLSEMMVWGNPKRHTMFCQGTYLLPGGFGERHRLDPLGEVVGGYQQKPQLKLRSGEWSNCVQPPLHEGSRVAQGVKVSTRPV